MQNSTDITKGFFATTLASKDVHIIKIRPDPPPCWIFFRSQFFWSKRTRHRKTLGSIVSFLPAPRPHIGAEPGRAKGESRITCMRMLSMNQSKISRPQPSAQTIRVCARNALFCQISNMAEDCCATSGFLWYICSSFSRLSRTFSIPKCYIWKV